MHGRLIVVSGTGTEVGKTHFAEALLLAWRRRVSRVVGLKPVETGVEDARECDAARLERASSFHVKHSAYAFHEGLSPHLASRRAGKSIEIRVVLDAIDSARGQADGVVVELPGGLFTPLASGVVNADVVALCQPDSLLLVAPDRLGVLHDVISTLRAAASLGLAVTGIVLATPERPDASTGTNAQELLHFIAVPVFATLPRASVSELALAPWMEPILHH